MIDQKKPEKKPENSEPVLTPEVTPPPEQAPGVKGGQGGGGRVELRSDSKGGGLRGSTNWMWATVFVVLIGLLIGGGLVLFLPERVVEVAGEDTGGLFGDLPLAG